MNDDDFWDDLLGHIRRQVLVTVTGPDLSVVGGTDQTLSTLIGQGLAEKYDLDVSPGVTTMGEAVAEFLRKPDNRDVAHRLYPVIYKIIKNIDPKPGEPLKDLAAISDLRLFVNTTPDRLLWQALNDVRSPAMAAVKEITFTPSKSTEEQKQDADEAANTDTVVLNLFGQATLPDYVIHDEDRLEWLHKLLTREASLPNWLDERLKSQPMLFVGCEVPDSIARFLLRMTSERRLSEQAKQFFFVNSSASHEPALLSFFKTFCRADRLQHLPMPPTQFVAELRARWDELSPAKQSPAPGLPGSPGPPAPDAPAIFISYMREDVDAARRLRDEIVELGGDVWLDERRILPGDWWQDEILTAIRRTVRLFIAIVSASTEKETDGYVFKEWRAAADKSSEIMGRRFIVPVVIDEDYDGNPYGYKHILEAFRGPDWGRAPRGDPNENLRAMLTDEIRAMRRTGAK